MKIENKLVETKWTDVVKVGQTRATQDMELVVLIIKAPLAFGTEVKEGFSAIILKDFKGGEFNFEIDNEYGVETAETILELFPVQIYSTLTLNEIHK